MKTLRKWLNRILNVLAGVSFLAMVIITTWQVITRYILGNPSSWSEELVSYLFAWASLLGACLVTGERGHMNIPIMVERFSQSGQKTFALAGEAIAILFSAIILLYGGMQITQLAMGQQTSSLGVAVGVFYFVLPLAGVLNGMYALLNISDIMSGTIPVGEKPDDEKKEA